MGFSPTGAQVTDDLLKVARGLRLVYIGLMIVVAAVVLGVVGVVAVTALLVGQARAGGAAPGAGALGPVIVVTVVVGLVALAGNAVGLVGRFFCLATPPEATTARPRIILSVIFEVCSVLGSVVGVIDSLAGQFLPGVLRVIGGGFRGLMALAAGIMFLLFAKALAEFVRRKKLGEDAMTVLKFFAATFVCYLISMGISLVMVAAVQGGADPGMAAFGCVSALLSLTALVIGIIGLVKYAKLLTALSDAVKKYANKRRKFEEEDEEDDEDSEEEGEEEEEEEDDRPSRRRRVDDVDDDDERPTRRRRYDD